MDSIEVLSVQELPTIQRAELNQQVVTARAFPRDVKRFADEVLTMATVTDEAAEACGYALPRTERDGTEKVIEGPSARLAEIVMSAWGNCRAAARISEVGTEFITAQGTFIDLERNTQVTVEIKRRITNRFGKRFNDDMISVTGNAACSIALRNAIFKGVPQGFWMHAYDAAKRKADDADLRLLTERAAKAMTMLTAMGAKQENVLRDLGVESVADMTAKHVKYLRGVVNAISEGITSAAAAFPDDGVPEAASKRAGPAAAVKAAVGGTEKQA